MNGIAAIRNLIQHSNRLLLDVMADVTPEQAHWLPPGTANTIAATYAHIVGVQDHYLNKVILGGPTIWTSEGWADRLGLSGGLRMERGSEALAKLDPASYRAYAERIFEATNAYLDRVTDDELAREVEGFRGPVAVGDMLARSMAFHCASHLGEICALKGIQGLKGLPF